MGERPRKCSTDFSQNTVPPKNYGTVDNIWFCIYYLYFFIYWIVWFNVLCL